MHGDANRLCFCKVVLLALNLSAGHIFSQVAVLIRHVSDVGAAVAVTNQFTLCDEIAIVSYQQRPNLKVPHCAGLDSLLPCKQGRPGVLML